MVFEHLYHTAPTTMLKYQNYTLIGMLWCEKSLNFPQYYLYSLPQTTYS